MKTMNRIMFLRRVLSMAGAIGLCASGLSAADVFWSGTTSDDWNTPANWAGGSVPVSGSVAVIDPVQQAVTRWGFQLTNAATVAGLRLTNLTQAVSSGASGSGELTVGAGGVSVSGSNATFALPCVLAAPQTWTVSSGVGLLQSGVLKGAASATAAKAGAGTLTLSGNNTFTGNINVDAGRLILSNQANLAGTMATRVFTTASGAALQIGTTMSLGGNNWTYPITLAGNGALEINPGVGCIVSFGGNTYYMITIAMTGGLIDVQSGTLRNDYNVQNWTTNKAAMNIAAGATFQPWNGNAVTIDALTGSGTVGGSQAYSGTGLTIGTNNGSGDFSGVITGIGAGAITKVGTGTQTFSGNNGFTGNINVNAGRLILSNQANLAGTMATRVFTTASGAALQIGTSMSLGGNNWTYPITLAGNGTLEINPGAGGLVQFGGQPWYMTSIAMTGGLIDVQSGILRNGGNVVQDWTTNKAALHIAAGATFQPCNGSAVTIDALTGSGTVGGNQTSIGTGLTIGTNNGSGDFSGVITNIGAGAITKVGSGTQTFSGNNYYPGTTAVQAGTLLVNGSLASDVVIVTNTATLGGTGTIKGVVTVASGATLAPGATNTTAGTLTVSSNLTLLVGSIINVDYNDTTSDVVRVNGTLAITNPCVVNLSAIGGATPPGRITLFSFSSGRLTGSGNLSAWTLQGAGLAGYTINVMSDDTSVYAKLARRGTTIKIY